MDIRILLVDDEEGLLKAVSAGLSLAGYEVDTSLSAIDALNKLKLKEYHIVITDINMPEMDGIEFLEKIKHILPTIEVIMITAYSTLSKVALSYSYGANDYILKPFEDLSEIEDVVNRTAIKVRRWKNVIRRTVKKKI